MSASSIWKTYNFSGDPFEVFRLFADKPYAFFLDSSLNSAGLGRYSFIGFEPFLVLRLSQRNLFQELRVNLDRFQLRRQPGLGPFLAGAIRWSKAMTAIL